MLRVDLHVMLWDFHQEMLTSPSSSLGGHLVWRFLTIIKHLAKMVSIQENIFCLDFSANNQYLFSLVCTCFTPN